MSCSEPMAAPTNGIARQVRASTLYAVERGIFVVYQIALLAVLTRSYSLGDVGRWSFATSVIMFAAPFLAASAEPVVVRELVRRRGEEAAVLGSSFALISITTLLSLALPLAYLAITNGADDIVIYSAVILTFNLLTSPLAIYEQYAKRLELAGLVVGTRFAAATVAMAAKLWLMMEGMPIWMICLPALLEYAGPPLAMAIALRARGHAVGRLIPRREEFTRLARQCLPLMFAGVFVTLFFRVNFLLLDWLSSFGEIANYALAFNIASAASMLPATALAGFYPRLVELHAKDQARYHQLIGWLFNAAGAYALAVCAGFALLGPALIPLAFGENLRGAVPVIGAMLLSQFAVASGAVRASIIAIEARQSLHLWSALAGLAVLVPLALVLIGRLDAVGAAMAVTIASFVSGIASTALFPQISHYLPRQIAGLVLCANVIKPRQSRPA